MMPGRKRISRSIIVAFATVVSLIHITPLLVVAANSLRTNDEIRLKMIGLPTRHFENFQVAWTKGEYLQAYVNNMIIGLSASFVVLLVTGLAAYGIIKVKSYFPSFFTGYFVAGLSIPAFAVIVPLFFYFNQLDLVNTRQGMIIIYSAINIPFNFMFVRAFFLGLPRELDEAARMDGASEIQNFWYNSLPLAKPIFSSVMLIVFVNVWNEFLFSNTFLQKDAVRTVALRFYNFVGKTGADYAYVYAAAVISILPIVVMYLLMQNTFIEGMTAGSIKG